MSGFPFKEGDKVRQTWWPEGEYVTITETWGDENDQFDAEFGDVLLDYYKSDGEWVAA